MPFAATWMQPEIIIPSELSQKKKDKYQYDITLMWNLKYGTNQWIYETERDSQTKKTDLRLPRGWKGGGGMDWECAVSRITWRMNKQQGPTV